LNGTPTTQQQAKIEALQTQIAVVKDPALLSAAPASELPLGVPAAYWEDLSSYQPAEVSKTLPMPMLILQGGRDYQVSPTLDFERWKTALAVKSNVTYRLYPDLNHLFIPGAGPSTPEDYNLAGHVDKAVIDGIATWINP
jgi:alpha-beta hydrolase superfamily lysophospholipase